MRGRSFPALGPELRKDLDLGGSSTTPPHRCSQPAATRTRDKGAGKRSLQRAVDNGCSNSAVGSLILSFPSWFHNFLRISSIPSITCDNFTSWGSWREGKTALSMLGANCSRGLEGPREARTTEELEGTSHNHHREVLPQGKSG